MLQTVVIISYFVWFCLVVTVQMMMSEYSFDEGIGSALCVDLTGNGPTQRDVIVTLTASSGTALGMPL